MPHVVIDGTGYQLPEGRTLMEALEEAGLLMKGVDIPHYCWHPMLSIDGSCRLCQVEVEGEAKLQIACNTPVRDGMVVHTRNPRVRDAREGAMELLLINHPLDCAICDQAGECTLQDYAFAYGPGHARTREPRRRGAKRVPLGRQLVFDEERCILCRCCVRFCDEISGTGELGIRGRGDRSTIATFPGDSVENDYSMNLADLCPVGAITTRDFRFKVRVWALEEVPGLCTGCARGCNVNIGVSKGEVVRYTPRRNDQVNDMWLCDAGRLSYAQIGAPDRIRHPALRHPEGPLREVPLGRAIDRAATLIRDAVDRAGPGAVATLASPHTTNEELGALRDFLARLDTATAGVAIVRGDPDALLLHAERAPNGAGARAAGFGEPGRVLDEIRGGVARVLLCFGHDILHEQFAGSEALFSDLDGLILVDTHHSALERVADVVIPGRHVAEMSGTLTNHAGRVQEVRAAVDPPFEAPTQADLLGRLAEALRL